METLAIVLAVLCLAVWSDRTLPAPLYADAGIVGIALFGAALYFGIHVAITA